VPLASIDDRDALAFGVVLRRKWPEDLRVLLPYIDRLDLDGRGRYRQAGQSLPRLGEASIRVRAAHARAALVARS
jgi:hypothetical protein